MTQAVRTPSRGAAIRTLERGHDEVRGLLAHLPPRAITTVGLGGGEWSPKDLIGHLASWEEHALEALDAWAAGRGPAIDKLQWSSTTGRINDEAVRRTARLSVREVTLRADATHAELIQRLRAMSDARWRRPGTSRGRKSVGERLGGILGGTGGPFRHADAHLKELRAFVDTQQGRGGSR